MLWKFELVWIIQYFISLQGKLDWFGRTNVYTSTKVQLLGFPLIRVWISGLGLLIIYILIKQITLHNILCLWNFPSWTSCHTHFLTFTVGFVSNFDMERITLYMFLFLIYLIELVSIHIFLFIIFYIWLSFIFWCRMLRTMFLFIE